MVRMSQTRKDWYWGVWFPYATPKYSFFTRLACHNKLSTGDWMLSWSINSKMDCSFCGDPIETRNHLFFLCPYSCQVWDTLMKKLILADYSPDWDHVVHLLYNSTFDKLKLFLLRYAFQTVSYHLWRERNQRRHGEAPTSPTNLVKLIEKNVWCGHPWEDYKSAEYNYAKYESAKYKSVDYNYVE